MNKFYIQIVFFLLSIFIYTNNKTLATGLTPKEQNNKTLPTVVTPKEQNNKTFTTNLITREQIDKILASGLTPREQSNKIIDTILNPEEQNKGPRIHVLTPEEHAKIAADTRKSMASSSVYGKAFKRKTKTEPEKTNTEPEKTKTIIIPEKIKTIIIPEKTKTEPEKTKTKQKTKTKEKEEEEEEKEEEEEEKEEEKTKTESKKRYATPEEIYEKNKDLLCTNPNEITNAIKLMNEAATHLEHHATTEEDYELWKQNPYINNFFFIKKHGDTYVQRIILTYYHPQKYNEIINVLWDPALANVFNPHFVKRKIARVYNPNLVIIRQRYKSRVGGPMKYFYALAAKIDISEEKTIIVMTSANINDRHASEKEYKNTIIESANLFKIDIDSNESIKKGKWEKTFVNIAGYLIEKKDGVKITYLESIEGHTSNYHEIFIETALNKFFSL
ncbi:fam-a protein [Plasmodium vinckei brucechwatti]|uniref:Fam-a protein n=1 Tax=Plasmodium vinckei brucechwatti TaxID=119398 RepID=A0A6V7SFP5_PLAVN|nr:fam-a protein [Plasmodium vinckei brucechwatti]